MSASPLGYSEGYDQTWPARAENGPQAQPQILGGSPSAAEGHGVGPDMTLSWAPAGSAQHVIARGFTGGHSFPPTGPAGGYYGISNGGAHRPFAFLQGSAGASFSGGDHLSRTYFGPSPR